MSASPESGRSDTAKTTEFRGRFRPIAVIGTAAALGDAGSPASDTTLGPTAGLNADGQHDHIWGTVVLTFLHFAIPLIAFGWLAAMVL